MFYQKLNCNVSKILCGKLHSDNVDSCRAVLPGFSATSQSRARASRVLCTLATTAYQLYRSRYLQSREMGSAPYFEPYRVRPLALADKTNLSSSHRADTVDRTPIVLFVFFVPLSPFYLLSHIIFSFPAAFAARLLSFYICSSLLLFS